MSHIILKKLSVASEVNMHRSQCKMYVEEKLEDFRGLWARDIIFLTMRKGGRVLDSHHGPLCSIFKKRHITLIMCVIEIWLLQMMV